MRIAIAIEASRGDRKISAALATARSKIVLASRRPPDSSGCSTCRSGRPATGRIEVHIVLLQLPGEAPECDAVELRAGQHRDRAGTGLLDDVADAVEVTDDRHALDLAHRVLTSGEHHRQAGRDDLHAVIVLAAQLADQIGHGGAMPDGHDAAHVAAAPPLPVEPLAQQVAAVQREAGREGQGADDVATRDLGLRGVREDRDQRRQGEAGLQDAAELLWPHTEQLSLVPAPQPECAGPQEGQPEAEHDVRGAPGVADRGVAEADAECHETAEQRGREVEGEGLPGIAGRPGHDLFSAPRDGPNSRARLIDDRHLTPCRDVTFVHLRR
jgi:hypothetical protein